MQLERNSLASRITAIILASSGIALCSLVAGMAIADHQASRVQLRNRLTVLADVEGQNSAAALVFDDPNAAVQVLSALHADTPVVSGCLYEKNGRLFAEYLREDAPTQCPQKVNQVSRRIADEVIVSRDVRQKGDSVGSLRITSDLRDVHRRNLQLLLVAALLLLFTLAIGGISGSVLQRAISQPIRELAAAMGDVTSGRNFGIRVEVPGLREIGQLAASFNSMLYELEKHEHDVRAARTKLQYQALNDELTGLPNRRLAQDRLTQALALAQRSQTQLALLFLDLDGFKLVNDSFGHGIGDRLLYQVAARLRSRVRTSDTLARLGGDEFTVILAPIATAEASGELAKELLRILAVPFQVESHTLTISASIGISIYPDQASDAISLMQQADCAMYAAKRAGKNRFHYYSDELGISMRERTNLESQLRHAIDRGEISVHYQPEFDTETQRLVRFEALARWTHPTLGAIPPTKFIPVAEESGIIVPLGSYILETACHEAMKWQELSPTPVGVAVNVSSVQFDRGNVVSAVRDALQHSGLRPDLLQLELTESVVLNGAEYTREIMNRLHELGVSLAIDDFGTGYSSLSYLPRLPFDMLKIDASFVRELGYKPQIAVMIRSVVKMALGMGMRVIVEGVETEQQYSDLQSLGAHELQGYLLGRPTATPEIHLQDASAGKDISRLVESNVAVAKLNQSAAKEEFA